MKYLSLPLLLVPFLLAACGSDAEEVGPLSNDDPQAMPGDTFVASVDAEAEESREVQSRSEGADDGDATARASVREDLEWDVGAPGPFNAGHRTAEVTYQSLSVGTERTIEYHIWYPTEAKEGEEVYYAEIFIDEEALGQAALAPPVSGDTYPLHVHSHGNLGYAGSSPHLMRHFATHGWVVVAPSHKGNTIIDNISPRPGCTRSAPRTSRQPSTL